ncbi:MAG: hypothetical protein ABIO70_36995 [Pseudomonadota bacterium]
MKRRALLLLLLLPVLGGIGLALWLRRPPPPPPEVAQPEDGDTGFSRQATEDRMRAIGYVQ